MFAFEVLHSVNCVLIDNIGSGLKYMSNQLIADPIFCQFILSQCTLYLQDEDIGMKSKVHHIAKEIMSSEKV